ncbi:MAG: hypothetical protein ACI4TD_04305 [Phocaeicola sp.]
MIKWKSEDECLNNAFGLNTATEWKNITLDLVKQYVESNEQAELPIYPKTTDTEDLEEADYDKKIMVEVSKILDVKFYGYDDQPYTDTSKMKEELELDDRLESENDDLESAYRTGNLASYLFDNYGEEYRVDRSGDYSSVEICVATGGPVILIDTDSKCIRIAWGGKCENYGIRYEIVDAIDDIMREEWNMRKERL